MEFVTITTTSVPEGTRMSGPAIWSARPTSAKAGTVALGASAPSGRHMPRRVSRRSRSIPSRRVPPGRRLSFGRICSVELRGVGPVAATHTASNTTDARPSDALKDTGTSSRLKGPYLEEYVNESSGGRHSRPHRMHGSIHGRTARGQEHQRVDQSLAEGRLRLHLQRRERSPLGGGAGHADPARGWRMARGRPDRERAGTLRASERPRRGGSRRRPADGSHGAQPDAGRSQRSREYGHLHAPAAAGRRSAGVQRRRAGGRERPADSEGRPGRLSQSWYYSGRLERRAARRLTHVAPA